VCRGNATNLPFWNVLQLIKNFKFLCLFEIWLFLTRFGFFQDMVWLFFSRDVWQPWFQTKDWPGLDTQNNRKKSTRSRPAIKCFRTSIKKTQQRLAAKGNLHAYMACQRQMIPVQVAIEYLIVGGEARQAEVASNAKVFDDGLAQNFQMFDEPHLVSLARVVHVALDSATENVRGHLR